ncbi:MAG: MlaC/ttg2D family ABC transporter substrate-binding protein [Microvirgula sp.]
MKRIAAVFAFLAWGFMPVAAYADNPDAVVRQTAQQVLETIRKDTGRNPARLRGEIEALATPKFDFTRMTALAVGRGWRQATPEQQAQLTDAFQTLLVRTYASTMIRFKNAQVSVADNPIVSSNGREATVRSSVQTGDASNKPVQIDYTLYRTAAGWKVYNVTVEGASLVTVYRSNFNEVVSKQGIDGLIQSIRDKNAQLAAKGGA